MSFPISLAHPCRCNISSRVRDRCGIDDSATGTGRLVDGFGEPFYGFQFWRFGCDGQECPCYVGCDGGLLRNFSPDSTMRDYEHLDIVLDPDLDPAKLVDDELREALILNPGGERD